MLVDREVSVLPISISTALAFEGLFHLNPEELGEKEFKYKRESIWINLRTLYRNLMGAIKSDVEYDDEMLISDFKEEIIILISILNENGVNGKNKVTLYANSHSTLNKIFPYAKLKKPKTEKQIQYMNHEKKILDSVLEDLETIEQYDVKKDDYMLEGGDQNAIILTHQPVDLLSRYKFSELKLLESHTGNVKVQSQWNTKLTGGSKNPRIPFNSFTLQIFGDNSTNFYSWSLGYKSALIELAQEAKWNSLTGTEKIIRDLAKVKQNSPVVFELFEQLLKTKMFF